MKATKFIVIGVYSHEQNSWIPDGDIRHVCSCHNTLRGASIAAGKAHFSLGGYDGSNMLAEVMQKFARIGSKKAKRYTEADYYDYERHSANMYEHAGWLYLEVSIWDRSEVVATSGGFGFRYL